MDTAARHSSILDRLRESGSVEVADLASRLDASEVTIRRDLDVLESAGVLRRIRGGAVSVLLRGQELPFAMREVSDADVKDRMAAAVAGLLHDGEAVIVDSGTTGLAVARAIVDRSLTVTPLSIHNAVALLSSQAVDLLMPGGTARRTEGTFVGPLTESSLRGFRYDTTVLTCCGLTADLDVMAVDVNDAAVKRTAVSVAARTVLVAESAKFARAALAVVCPVTDIDVLVTDSAAPAAALTAARRAGVDVVTV